MSEEITQYQVEACIREAWDTFRPISLIEYMDYRLYEMGIESPHNVLIADNGVVKTAGGEFVFL